MINHQYLAADVILELVALLMALNDQYIFHGEIFCFKFWIFPAIDPHLAFACRFVQTSAHNISYVNVLAAS